MLLDIVISAFDVSRPQQEHGDNYSHFIKPKRSSISFLFRWMKYHLFRLIHTQIVTKIVLLQKTGLRDAQVLDYFTCILNQCNGIPTTPNGVKVASSLIVPLHLHLNVEHDDGVPAIPKR